MDRVVCVVLDTKVPGHGCKQLTQTWIVCLQETHILHQSLFVKSQQNRNKVKTRPDGEDRNHLYS